MNLLSNSVNTIVATGSVDGILTTAAMLRLVGNADQVEVVFAQAFTVDKVDPSTWKPNSKVAFVDLAVNNRDKAMTADFVRRIREAGHQIVAVCDEHCREDWLEILGSFDGLLIEPQSQAEGKYHSSGAVLQDFAESMYAHGYGDECNDPHLFELLQAADAADRMEFRGVGALVNQAVKSKIADDTRRVYLAKHFSNNTEADSTIQGWIKEYEEILVNHQAILTAKQDLGDGIVRVSTIGKVVDMTTLMSQLYKSGARVVVCEGEMFDKSIGAKRRLIAFGTNDRGLDLLACLQQANIPASGFAQKANVDPANEAEAIMALRERLVG